MFSNPFYIVGNLQGDERPVVAAVTPTSVGWKCRSTVRGALCHDYVSDESVGNVRSWVERDLSGKDYFFTRNREEVLERLATRFGTSDSVGFLTPGAHLSSMDAAERVLRHLESGW